MKNYILLLISILAISNTSCAQSKLSKSKKKKKTTIQKTITTENNVEKNEIDWITWEEAQKRMATNPKKVYVDIYTDWCGWCKVMEKKTFTNTNVIKYINDNFYAIRFNSEKDDNINFQNKMYKLQGGTNELARKLCNGAMSYPTSIFMEENFANPQPVPGYLDIKNIEPILHYLGGNHQKTTPFQDFQKSYLPKW